jgi:hypothetical protein
MIINALKKGNKMPATQDLFDKHTSKKLKYAKEVFTWMINNTKTMQKHEQFDYPEYGGMPHKLSSKLSSWTVDLIQDNWDTVQKNKSMKYLVDRFLFWGWD